MHSSTPSGHLSDSSATTSFSSTPSPLASTLSSPSPMPPPPLVSANGLPEGWYECVEAQTGRTYFYQAEKKTSQWNHPAATPPPIDSRIAPQQFRRPRLVTGATSGTYHNYSFPQSPASSCSLSSLNSESTPSNEQSPRSSTNSSTTSQPFPKRTEPECMSVDVYEMLWSRDQREKFFEETTCDLIHLDPPEAAADSSNEDPIVRTSGRKKDVKSGRKKDSRTITFPIPKFDIPKKAREASRKEWRGRFAFAIGESTQLQPLSEGSLDQDKDLGDCNMYELVNIIRHPESNVTACWHEKCNTRILVSQVMK
jgi:hypothetical protein